MERSEISPEPKRRDFVKKSCAVVDPGLAAEGVQENQQAGNGRNEAGDGSNNDGTGLFDEIAALRLG